MNPESPLDRFRRWYRLLPPALRFLMTVNTVLFVAWIFIALSRPAATFVVEYFALTPVLPVPLFRPWQLLTYSVLHLEGGFWGLIGFAFNMLWLYWMGRDYEETYGSHRLFGLYILAALAGGLAAVLFGALLPAERLFPVVGAMAPVFGVLCCVAALYPNRGIGMLLIGVVPLKWLAVGFLTLSVLFSLGHPANVLTYLGAAGMGVLFARAQQRGTDLAAWAQGFFPNRTDAGYSAPRRTSKEEKGGFLARMDAWLGGRNKDEEPEERRRMTKASRPSAPSAPSRREQREIRAASAGTAGQDDVDRILDKISERGYDALTEEEKRILYEASQR